MNSPPLSESRKALRLRTNEKTATGPLRPTFPQTPTDSEASSSTRPSPIEASSSFESAVPNVEVRGHLGSDAEPETATETAPEVASAVCSLRASDERRIEGLSKNQCNNSTSSSTPPSTLAAHSLLELIQSHREGKLDASSAHITQINPADFVAFLHELRKPDNHALSTYFARLRYSWDDRSGLFIIHMVTDIHELATAAFERCLIDGFQELATRAPSLAPIIEQILYPKAATIFGRRRDDQEGDDVQARRLPDLSLGYGESDTPFVLEVALSQTPIDLPTIAEWYFNEAAESRIKTVVAIDIEYKLPAPTAEIPTPVRPVRLTKWHLNSDPNADSPLDIEPDELLIREADGTALQGALHIPLSHLVPDAALGDAEATDDLAVRIPYDALATAIRNGERRWERKKSAHHRANADANASSSRSRPYILVPGAKRKRSFSPPADGKDTGKSEVRRRNSARLAELAVKEREVPLRGGVADPEGIDAVERGGGGEG